MLLTELLDRVTVDDGCWTYDGAHTKNGYAVARLVNVGVRPVHKLLYELWMRPVPRGAELDHLCRNRGCVNPWHVEPVTHGENVRRGASVGLHKPVCPRGHAKVRRADGRMWCRECPRESERRRRRVA